MICVSIGRSRHRHMIAEHRHLVEQGAKLVELRLDYINGEVNLGRLLADRPCPVVITCRRESDGGKWTGTEQARLMLLRTAIAEGVEYIDLEEEAAALIPRYGKTKRIISLHDFRQTPTNLDGIHARLAALDADIVKIASMANVPNDNLRMLRLIAEAKVPTVGICMGEIGTPSRLLAARFGAPFSYATFSHERALAPGQLSFNQMKEIYHYDQIDRETEVYGVIGDPIGHSLSPVIHNPAFRSLGLNKVYIPFRIPRAELDGFLSDCPALGIRGLSVTIPHKEAVIRKLTRVDGAVRGIGACNTIVFDQNEAIGYNTDFRGAFASLDEVLGNGGERQNLLGRTALVLGAGGVSRAIVFGLKRRGADVVITNRTQSRADDLAARTGSRAIDWNSRHSIKPDVLVNCTPVGMHPNVDETPFERHYLKPTTIVFDTVYNPEQTLLVKEAKQQSCNVITGVDMFIGQAAFQFQLFTGKAAPVELMRETLRKTIGAAK